MALQFFIIDAFTATPFTGNNAGVIHLPSTGEPSDSTLLQSLAAELNQPASAFLRPLSKDRYHVRFFTPTTEVPLCGHATLASSHAIFTTSSATCVTFETLGGTVVARKKEYGRIAMDFPADHEVLEPLLKGRKYDHAVAAAIAAAPAVDGNIVGVAWGGQGPLVELSQEVDLETLAVDPTVLLETVGLLTFTQAAPAESEFDIFSRVFPIALGITEDSVTGSAHTRIVPYWLGTSARARLGSKFARDEMKVKARQVSGRGGEMEVTWEREKGRVELVGSAKTIARGELQL